MTYSKSIFAIAAVSSTIVIGYSLSLAQNTPEVAPIELHSLTDLPQIYAYHGMILDRDLNVIEPSVQNAQSILSAYISAFSEHQPDRVSDLSDTFLRSSLFVNANDDIAMLTGSFAAVEWLIDNSGAEQRALYESHFSPVRAWLSRMIEIENQVLLVEHQELFEAFGNSDLFATETFITADSEDYIGRCADENVPIPPAWGSSEWEFQGIQSPDYTFAGDPTSITEIWAFSDDSVAGACIALPRRDRDTNEITLLGIICQSETTGAACFWDNIDRETGMRLVGEDNENFLISNVQNADELGENCTNCHRGYNVFLIHPDTSLDIGTSFAIDPLQRYSPVSSQATWGNPGPLIDAGNRPCASCHEIPEFGDNNGAGNVAGSAYCRILERVIDNSMPNIYAPAGWANPRRRFAPHVDMFREMCVVPLLLAGE